VLLVSGVLAGGALLLLAGHALGGRLLSVWAGLHNLGAWAAVVFIALYCAATVLWIPGSVLTLAAGAAFGLVAGTVYALIGATTGASLAFLVARYLARSHIERRLVSYPKLRAIDTAVEHQGRKVVLLLRLSPLFPFNALNYALGLTAVRFRDFLLGSAVGMVPGTLMYVYAGHAAGEVAAGAAGADRGAGHYVLLGVGLLATLGVTAILTRAARRSLEALRRGGPSIDGPRGDGSRSSPVAGPPWPDESPRRRSPGPRD